MPPLCASRLAMIMCLLMLVCVVHSGQLALAQEASAPADDLQRLPSDRKMAQQLQELTRLARGDNLSKIRDTLQLLRAADPALMVPDRSSTFRPLHRDLIERIQAFSPQLQSALLKDAGATPQSLMSAFEHGGPGGLLLFLQRYAGTAESLKAHLLLAAIHRDRGHRQAALYWLAPILHDNAPESLRTVAVAWRDELNPGSQLSEDADPDLDSALDLGNRDDAEKSNPPGAETESDQTVFPHKPAWKQKLYLSSAQRRASQDLVRLLATEGDHQAIAWTAGEPIVDAQAVFVRSSGGLLAWDRQSGKVLWTRLLDRQPDTQRMAGTRMQIPDGNDRSAIEINQLQNSRDVLELHRDDITTRMTADSTRLFVICDTGESAGSLTSPGEPFRMFQGRGVSALRSLRELVAIEKATGRRLWSVGGLPMEERFGNELSRAWFAGPPTVSGALLYGVVEQDDAHWLVCLQSETGEVVWKRMLAYPETNINQDLYRQLESSRPLVADGMIWTNTSDGWLIAIDELTKTVVWSRNMIQRTPDSVRTRNVRSAVLQIQPLQPFREIWRPGSMLLLPDSLLLTGLQNHQLLLINPLTGGVRRGTSRENATVILCSDEESIVTAGPNTIQRLQTRDFKALWTAQLPAGDVAPTGPGARIGNHLLIPLSDGSVQVVRYSDGQLTDNLSGLRPAFSAGGLTSILGDVVSYGVDHVTMYSQSGTAGALEPKPIDQARFLIETGKFAEAEQVLLEITPTTDQAEIVQRLLFRTSAALTLSDASQRVQHVQDAARYAASAQDSAIVQYLMLETEPEIASDQVVDFLNSPLSVLTTELPNFEELKAQLLSPVIDVPTRFQGSDPLSLAVGTRPVRHLLLQLFDQNLKDTSAPTSATWMSALRQISSHDLLSLNHHCEVLRDELLNRAESAIEAGHLTEITLHLLLQAQRTAVEIRRHESASLELPSSTDNFASRLSLLVDRFETGLAVEATRTDATLKPHPAALDLLAVLRMESLATRATTAGVLSPNEVLAQQWSEWKDQTYSLIPVNPVTSSTIPQNNERTLTPRTFDDRFLSGWRWSTIREPSLLAVRSLVKPDQALCTIDGGTFDTLSFGNNGSVVRYGSVILVQNSNGLSAVSVIDQRVLWSRRIPNQSSNILWHLMSEMQLFSSFQNRLPAWQMIFGRDLRICGGNERWICLQSPSRIEMIDLLTGQNLWSRPAESARQYAFATETCVFLSPFKTDSPRANNSGPMSEFCLNRIDGSLRETKITQSQLRQAILATGDELVIWNQANARDRSPSLSWINAETGEVRHHVTLNDMQNCHFMDVQTLVSQTRNNTFEVIDLVTAQKQVVQLKADLDLQDAKNAEATPVLPSRFLVVADPVNYYVFPFPDRQAVQMQIMLGSNGDLNLYPVHKELRAIDRMSGNTRWIWRTDDTTAAWFDPTADPVLLLVTNSARQNNAKGPPAFAIPGLILPANRQTNITGLSRMTGTKLFDFNVASRFPVPGLRFRITPQQHLDLQAYGNRVRFIPDAVSQPDADSQPDGKPNAVD